MALHACFEQSVTFNFHLDWIGCGKIAFENLKEFFFQSFFFQETCNNCHKRKHDVDISKEKEQEVTEYF